MKKPIEKSERQRLARTRSEQLTASPRNKADPEFSTAHPRREPGKATESGARTAPPSPANTPSIPPLPASPGPRTLEQCFRKPRTRLAKLVAQVRRLREINEVFHAYLPAHLRPHANLVRLGQEYWVVHTDSPAWATRLRYCLPALQHQLSQQLGFAVPRLRSRVVPPKDDQQSRTPARQLELSVQASSVLVKAAEAVEDQALSAALRRLARHARKPERIEST